MSLPVLKLTPNRRLAATLVKQYQQQQIKQGLLSWRTPPIMPFRSWLEKNWYEKSTISEKSLLLTPSQEHVIWEEIISASPESQHLLHFSRTVKWVISAWELLKQWNVPLDHPELGLTEEGVLFQTWAKQFQKQCFKNHWLEMASLPHAIGLMIQDKQLFLPKIIKLVGFIELTPQMQSLLSICREQGTVILRSVSDEGSSSSPGSFVANAPQDDITNKTACRVPLNNHEEELLIMARWAKALYDQQNPTKTISIGCILPELENDRDAVQRVFQEIFLGEMPFNISAGKKLTSFPIIHTALQLLGLSHSISTETLGPLLRSPFIGEAETENQKRALLDIRLRRLNITTLTINSLLALSTDCPFIQARFQQYADRSFALPEKLRPSQWAEIFSELLILLGWPGERVLNSEEYQVVQNGWLTLLQEFSKLDVTISSLKRKKALHYLTQLASQIIFQPQSPDAPIQLLGTLEAAGLFFDNIWVMGLNDTSWPAPPSPNPFIPLRLQKQLNMPNSSADRELAYAKIILEQFYHSSHSVVMSYSTQEKESTLRPSTLIKHLPIKEINQLDLSPYVPLAYSLFEHRKFEILNDALGPPVSENESIQGGSRIFKLQAACPFKAYAELRLNADYLEPTSPGLKASDRGKILHKVFELIWKELKDSVQLHSLDYDTLEAMILSCIDQAFEHSYAIKQIKKKSRYLTIEKKRLKNILLQWFKEEKKRPPFRVIACEQEYHVTLGKINFKLRIDRIDELNSEEKLIIDYKSGKYNEISGWFGNRPDEPQLPLYCVTQTASITAITFAELHPDAVKYKGVSQKSLAIGGIKPITEIKQSDVKLWEEQINHWRTILTKLGNDFFQGIAIVDPKKGEETCRQCHLQGLCRINSAVILRSVSDEESKQI